jgi:hypothetical protein
VGLGLAVTTPAVTTMPSITTTPSGISVLGSGAGVTATATQPSVGLPPGVSFTGEMGVMKSRGSTASPDMATSTGMIPNKFGRSEDWLSGLPIPFIGGGAVASLPAAVLFTPIFIADVITGKKGQTLGEFQTTYLPTSKVQDIPFFGNIAKDASVPLMTEYQIGAPENSFMTTMAGGNKDFNYKIATSMKGLDSAPWVPSKGELITGGSPELTSLQTSLGSQASAIKQNKGLLSNLAVGHINSNNEWIGTENEWNQYNALAQKIKSDVDAYNLGIDKYNALAAAKPYYKTSYDMSTTTPILSKTSVIGDTNFNEFQRGVGSFLPPTSHVESMWQMGYNMTGVGRILPPGGDSTMHTLISGAAGAYSQVRDKPFDTFNTVAASAAMGWGFKSLLGAGSAATSMAVASKVPWLVKAGQIASSPVAGTAFDLAQIGVGTVIVGGAVQDIAKLPTPRERGAKLMETALSFGAFSVGMGSGWTPDIKSPTSRWYNPSAGGKGFGYVKGTAPDGTVMRKVSYGEGTGEFYGTEYGQSSGERSFSFGKRVSDNSLITQIKYAAKTTEGVPQLKYINTVRKLPDVFGSVYEKPQSVPTDGSPRPEPNWGLPSGNQPESQMIKTTSVGNNEFVMGKHPSLNTIIPEGTVLKPTVVSNDIVKLYRGIDFDSLEGIRARNGESPIIAKRPVTDEGLLKWYEGVNSKADIAKRDSLGRWYGEELNTGYPLEDNIPGQTLYVYVPKGIAEKYRVSNIERKSITWDGGRPEEVAPWAYTSHGMEEKEFFLPREIAAEGKTINAWEQRNLDIQTGKRTNKPTAEEIAFFTEKYGSRPEMIRRGGKPLERKRGGLTVTKSTTTKNVGGYFNDGYGNYFGSVHSGSHELQTGGGGGTGAISRSRSTPTPKTVTSTVTKVFTSPATRSRTMTPYVSRVMPESPSTARARSKAISYARELYDSSDLTGTETVVGSQAIAAAGSQSRSQGMVNVGAMPTEMSGSRTTPSGVSLSREFSGSRALSVPRSESSAMAESTARSMGLSKSSVRSISDAFVGAFTTEMSTARTGGRLQAVSYSSGMSDITPSGKANALSYMDSRADVATYRNPIETITPWIEQKTTITKDPWKETKPTVTDPPWKDPWVEPPYKPIVIIPPAAVLPPFPGLPGGGSGAGSPGRGTGASSHTETIGIMSSLRSFFERPLLQRPVQRRPRQQRQPQRQQINLKSIMKPGKKRKGMW